MKGWLIDADYITENNRAVIRLWCKDDEGVFIVYDRNFEPYFYLIPQDNVDVSDVERVIIQGKNRVIKPKRVEWVKKKVFGKEIDVLKIVAEHPQDVPKLREEMKKFGDVREADILFAYRYLIDRDLACMDGIIAEGEVRKEKDLRVVDAEKVRRKRLNGFPELSVMVFDCEMFPSSGMPDPERDPIIIIGVKSGDYEELIHGNEREILTKFVKIVRNLDPDVIAGYNQDNFDWPYIKKRAEKLSVKLNIGRDGSELTFRGGRPKIVGRLNVDLYDIAMRLDVKIKTLDRVAEFLGKKVEIADIEAKDIRKKWLEGDKESVLRYAKQDVLNTYFIAEELLPLHYDLSKMIRIPLDDVTRIGRGKQVDWLLFSEAYNMNEIAPNPSEIEESYEGAFVLEPVRGLHENVYCLDFASMYPSIMIAFNISPDTLVMNGCNDCYTAPEVGYKFKKHPDGFFKRILEDLIRKRGEIKERMKEIDRNSLEYRLLNIRQQTLKVLANSILPDEWLPVIESGEIKFVKIGAFIDKLMEKYRNNVKEIENSEVLEVDGIKAFSFNRKNKKSQIKPVKALIRHRYDGNVYDVELESGRRIKITEGHSLFTVRKGEITEISGNEIKRGDLIVVPKAIRIDGKTMTLNIPKLLCRLPRSKTKNMVLTIPGRKNFFKGMLRALRWIFSEDGNKIRIRYATHLENLGLVKLNSIEVTDWNALNAYKTFCEKLVENAKYDHNKRECVIHFDDIRDVIDRIPDREFEAWKIGTIKGFKMPAVIHVDEEFGKLLGYYVSKGYSRQKGRYTVRIYNHSQSVLDDVQRLAEKFFGKVRKRKTYVEIPKKIAHLIFWTLCGSKANNKRIPSEILMSPENVRWAFLEGYLIGNGDIHPFKRFRLSTKSEILMNQLVFLLNSLGISAIKLRFDSGVFNITEDAETIEWLIEGDLVLDRVKNVRVEKYSGWVYDLSVQDDENFLVGFGLLYAHNSFYGYMGWSGARWYCRPCAEATTAWGRYFIKRAISIARDMGFEVLYSDTDSLFVKKDGINESEVRKLIKAISKEMPIDIDIDEVYGSIFFVEKKRYAGLTMDGRVIVKGLEVRRGDWCELAKEVQKDVIEIILKEKNPEKALRHVRKVIEKIKKGGYPLEKFIIYKGLTRKPSKYESMQAHVKAALRAMEMGIFFTPGSKVGYIVLEGSGNVGDRAYPIELVEDFDGEFVKIRTKSGVERRKIDKNYYINHQVIPSVLRILEQFGYNELSVKGESQMTLDSFF